MGLDFLIDSNIVIYYSDGLMSEAQYDLISDIFENSFQVSTITKVEVLGYFKIPDLDKRRLEIFFQPAKVFIVDNQIEQRAIEFKQHFKIKTADAIIAATALVFNLTLVTRNVADFKKLPNLRVFNPFENEK